MQIFLHIDTTYTLYAAVHILDVQSHIPQLRQPKF